MPSLAVSRRIYVLLSGSYPPDFDCTFHANALLVADEQGRIALAYQSPVSTLAARKVHRGCSREDPVAVLMSFGGTTGPG